MNKTRSDRVVENNRLLKQAGFDWEKRQQMRHWNRTRVLAAINKKFQQRIHIINQYPPQDLSYDPDGYKRIKQRGEPYGWYVTKDGSNGYRAMSVGEDGVFEQRVLKYSDAVQWLRGWKAVG